MTAFPIVKSKIQKTHWNLKKTYETGCTVSTHQIQHESAHMKTYQKDPSFLHVNGHGSTKHRKYQISRLLQLLIRAPQSRASPRNRPQIQKYTAALILNILRWSVIFKPVWYCLQNKCSIKPTCFLFDTMLWHWLWP